MSKSRNIRLTPIQRDVLWTLEEAGEEELWTVWITVQGEHKAMPADQFRVEFVDGLLGLQRLGYVRLVRGLYGTAGGETEVSREESDRLWTSEMRAVAEGVLVEMPDAGYEAIGEPGGQK